MQIERDHISNLNNGLTKGGIEKLVEDEIRKEQEARRMAAKDGHAVNEEKPEAKRESHEDAGQSNKPGSGTEDRRKMADEAEKRLQRLLRATRTKDRGECR